MTGGRYVATRLLSHELGECMRGRGYRVWVVSMMDGFNILLVQGRGRRVLVWVRPSPITRRALQRFRRLVEKYRVDEIVVYKTSQGKPDYENTPYTYAETPEELVKEIEKS